MNDVALIPTRDEMAIYESIAKYAADSRSFEKLGGLGGIICIALRAREMGISPLEAIYGGFSNVQGKLTMSAELMGSLIRRGGHKLEILQSSGSVCEIKGTRSDTGETYTAAFTIEEARLAGLVKGGSGWEKYPSDMLYARCISRLRRRLFQDIATKAYVEGEIEAESKAEAPISEPSVINVTPPTNDTIETEKRDQSEPKVTIAQALELENLAGGDEAIIRNLFNAYQVDSFHKLKEKNFNYIKERLLSFRQGSANAAS